MKGAGGVIPAFQGMADVEAEDTQDFLEVRCIEIEFLKRFVVSECLFGLDPSQ